MTGSTNYPTLLTTILGGDKTLQFELLRLSLLGRPNLFALRKDDSEMIASREDWIRHSFSREIVFLHRKDEYHYVPDPAISRTAKTHLISGRIGRRLFVKANEPPEAALHETESEIWRAALIFIDPSTHDDGQKIAMQQDGAIGTPLALVSSLIARINNETEAPYEIQTNAITDPSTFWDFEKAHKGEITSVTFEFIAPNMFPDRNEWDAEMREMRELEKARKVRLQLENSDGLELETDRVKGAVEYASRGTGSVKARTRKKQTFNSARKTRQVTSPDGLDLADVLHWLVDKAFGVRGAE